MSAMEHAQLPNFRQQVDFGSSWLPAFEPSWIFFVYTDELDQVFEPEGGECLDAIFSDAVDPDDAVLDGDAGDGFDVTDLVDVHHAARANSAGLGAVKFHGSNSSSR
jgi:hypothetical protein